MVISYPSLNVFRLHISIACHIVFYCISLCVRLFAGDMVMLHGVAFQIAHKTCHLLDYKTPGLGL